MTKEELGKIPFGQLLRWSLGVQVYLFQYSTFDDSAVYGEPGSIWCNENPKKAGIWERDENYHWFSLPNVTLPNVGESTTYIELNTV